MTSRLETGNSWTFFYGVDPDTISMLRSRPWHQLYAPLQTLTPSLCSAPDPDIISMLRCRPWHHLYAPLQTLTPSLCSAPDPVTISMLSSLVLMIFQKIFLPRMQSKIFHAFMKLFIVIIKTVELILHVSMYFYRTIQYIHKLIKVRNPARVQLYTHNVYKLYILQKISLFLIIF